MFSQNSQECNCAIFSFLVKLQAEASSFVKKESLTKVFSCKSCKIFKNVFIQPRVAGSEMNEQSERKL